MAPNVTVSFWDPYDINGTPLHTVDDEDPNFKGLTLKPDLTGLGGWELTLSREWAYGLLNDQAARGDVFVRFLISAYSDTEWYWGGLLDKRQITVVHKDELGAEEFILGGSGPKRYLDRFRLGIERNTPSGWHLDLVNGVWRWGENATAGSVLRKLITEDQNTDPTSLVDLTASFTASDDSNSDPWTEEVADAEGNFELPIGTSLLEALFDLEDIGDLVTTVYLGTVASPLYRLDAWQSYGEDVTGTAFGTGVGLLREGDNIANDALTVSGVLMKKATHVIIEGKDGVWAKKVLPAWSPGDYVRWAKIEYSRSSNVPTLQRAGLRWLRRQENGDKQLEVEIVPGADDTQGFYFPSPSSPIWLGNTVTVDTIADGSVHSPMDYDEAPMLVTGLELKLGQAGSDATADAKAKSWEAKVKLNGERAGYASSPNQSSASSGPGNGGGGNCTCNKPHIAPECPVSPGDTTVVDWDWTDCVNPSYVDAFAGGSPANPWGLGNVEGPWGSNGCGSTTNHNAFSAKFDVSPGDTLHVVWKNAKYGAGAATTSEFQMRFYDSGGSPIGTLDETMGTGVASNNHGGYANWVTSEADFTVPIGAVYGAVAQGTWSLHFTQRIIITIPGSAPGEIEFCIDYGDFPHESPFTLPSDYVEFRLDELQQQVSALPEDIADALSWKEPVRVATTAAGTLATSFENGDTVDGITLATGDRILIKDQAAGADNGIYTVNASGAPTRATDFTSDEQVVGAVVLVRQGTTNEDTIWILETDGVVVGTTALVFGQLSGGGGSGAPTTADYLVGTAQGGLSAEIVVGTTPGGELGGTWASPTVDSMHSGSAHHTENHTSRHGPSGADALRLDDLEVPQDNTDLNASTSAHGLLKKLDNNASHFMDGQGNWSSPAASGGGVDSVANYTPALTTSGAGADPNLGSTGTAVGRYAQIGPNLLWFAAVFEFLGSGISAGSGNYQVSLPGGFSLNSALLTQVIGSYYLDSGSQHRVGVAIIQASTPTLVDLISISSTNAGIVSSSAPQTPAAGDRYVIQGTIYIA